MLIYRSARNPNIFDVWLIFKLLKLLASSLPSRSPPRTFSCQQVFFIKATCCNFDQAFVRPLHGKYRTVTSALLLLALSKVGIFRCRIIKALKIKLYSDGESYCHTFFPIFLLTMNGKLFLMFLVIHFF